MTFSDKINRRKTELGKENIADIARSAKVSRSSCYRWFDGFALPDVHEAHRLARVLDVPLEYLADEDADEPQRLTPAEEQALKLVRSLGLDENEVIRRLAGGERKPGKPGGSYSGGQVLD